MVPLIDKVQCPGMCCEHLWPIGKDYRSVICLIDIYKFPLLTNKHPETFDVYGDYDFFIVCLMAIEEMLPILSTEACTMYTMYC